MADRKRLIDLKCVLQVRHVGKHQLRPEAVVGAKMVFLRDHSDPTNLEVVESELAWELLDRLLADMAELRAFLGVEAPLGEPVPRSLLSRADLLVIHQALITDGQMRSQGPAKDDAIALSLRVKDMLR